MKIGFNALERENGNVLIIVLVAVVLFAGLTAAISSMSRSSQTNLKEEGAELKAGELIQTATNAQARIQQMISYGSDIGDIDFMPPSDGAFNTPPNIHKAYHPQGGGLAYRTSLPTNIVNEVSSPPSAGWYAQTNVNVGWSESATDDIIYTAYQINKATCEQINKKIVGTTTIPALASSTMAEIFVPGSGDNDLTAAECAACEGYPMMCVTDSNGAAYSFYIILASE